MGIRHQSQGNSLVSLLACYLCFAAFNHYNTLEICTLKTPLKVLFDRYEHCPGSDISCYIFYIILFTVPRFIIFLLPIQFWAILI